MVTSSRGRSPYTGGSDGAPPTPPPGGYRGASRVRPTVPPAPEAPGTPGARPRPTAGGWIVLGLAGLFALVLLILWAAGATGAIYGGVTLVLQLGLLVAVVAVVVSPRGRRVGALALALVLLVNVGTIGAASAITHPPAADVVADPDADYWAAYPGIRGQEPDDILSRLSLEQAIGTGDAMLAAIRAELTDRFGYGWTPGVAGSTRAERNGYGGESLLVAYTSDNWATTEAIRDHAQKLATMAAIDDVLLDGGFSDLYSLNDPANGFDPAILERFYGSADIRTQATWEWVASDGTGVIRVYATLTDLTDDDGTFRAAREGQVAGSGEPLEGLRISVYAPEVLSEADVAEFLQRLEDYP